MLRGLFAQKRNFVVVAAAVVDIAVAVDNVVVAVAVAAVVVGWARASVKNLPFHRGNDDPSPIAQGSQVLQSRPHLHPRRLQLDSLTAPHLGQPVPDIQWLKHFRRPCATMWKTMRRVLVGVYY